jgi:hypothetical protein
MTDSPKAEPLRVPSALEPVHALMVAQLTAQGAPKKILDSWENFIRAVADWETEKNANTRTDNRAAASGS